MYLIDLQFATEDRIAISNVKILMVGASKIAACQRLSFLGFREHAALTARRIKDLDAKRGRDIVAA